MQMEDTVER